MDNAGLKSQVLTHNDGIQQDAPSVKHVSQVIAGVGLIVGAAHLEEHGGDRNA